MQHRVQDEVKGIMAFIAVIWLVFLVSLVSPVNLLAYGVIPRTAWGLVGIVASPFLHADWSHIVSNTVPLLVLLLLLAGSRANSAKIVLLIILLSGALLWLFGRPAIHVGASGLIFGLMVFLVASGILERRPLPLLVSLLVGFMYGGSFLVGIAPRFGSLVSWDGHLLGALAGGLVAYTLASRQKPVKPTGDLTDLRT